MCAGVSTIYYDKEGLAEFYKSAFDFCNTTLLKCKAFYQFTKMRIDDVLDEEFVSSRLVVLKVAQ